MVVRAKPEQEGSGLDPRCKVLVGVNRLQFVDQRAGQSPYHGAPSGGGDPRRTTMPHDPLCRDEDRLTIDPCSLTGPYPAE